MHRRRTRRSLRTLFEAVENRILFSGSSVSTALTASSDPATLGQPVTLSARVTPPSGVSTAPTGKIKFLDDGVVIGKGFLTSDVVDVTLNTLPMGTDNITAMYVGDSNFSGGTSSTLSEQVVAATQTTLSTSNRHGTFSESIVLTASVSSTDGTPGGTVKFKDGSTLLGSAQLNGSGVGTLTVSDLAVGTHPITAIYAGASSYARSSSNSLNQIVNTVTTTTTLTSSAPTAAFGQSVLLTATVTSSFAAPTGTVKFKDGSTLLGMAQLNNSGVGTLMVSDLAIGSHSITAIYVGNAGFVRSNSDTLSQTISPASTTTDLDTSAQADNYGQMLTFTATVSSEAGTPTGSVTFEDGATTLETVALNSSGIAQLSISDLPVGNDSITAIYSGGGVFAGSSSNSQNESISSAPTNIALASSANSANYGQSLTFTATVTSEAGTPSGSVTFEDSGTTLGSVVLNSSGIAQFNAGNLPVGSDSVTAVYSGGGVYAASSGSSRSELISEAPTSTILSISANPASYGQTLTFTATVSSQDGTPTGSVTFEEGSTVLGTENLNSSGVGQLQLSNFPIGGGSITAIYSSDGNFAASSSAAQNETVDQATTTTGLSVSANPATLGQTLTFTATVSSAGGTPTGSITFEDGSTVLGTVALNDYGVAGLTLADLAQGSHSITAIYSGDSNFQTSQSSALSQTINQGSLTNLGGIATAALTTTTIAASGSSSVYGQIVTITATVVSGAQTPTGSVTFEDGTTVLGTAELNSSGAGTLTLSNLSVGTHSIWAEYGGTTDFDSSTSSSTNFSVVQTSSGTTLTSSALSAAYGQPVTLTATVTSSAGTPTGSVSFDEGAIMLGTATLNSFGVATLSMNNLPVGANAITAVYTGDVDRTGSTSNTISQVIAQNSTTTTLSSSASSVSYGQSVTLTATVASGGGTPGGTVTFNNGSATLGTATLNSSGVATLTLSSLNGGSYSLTATYGGATNFAASTSGSLSQTITPDATKTSIVTSASPATAGQAVTFTATVTSSVAVTHGIVYFYDGDGATLLGSAGALNSSGVTTFVISSLSVGSHEITAEFLGSTSLSASTSNVITETIAAPGPVSTTTTVSSSASSATFGQTVTLTATVSSSGGTPGGSITFDDGSNSLGTATLNSNGVATLTLSSLSVGSHSITAVFAGNSSFAPSTSGTLSQTIAQASTTTSISSSASSAQFGQTITLTATVTSSAGTPSGSITFDNGSVSLGTATLNSNGVATLTASNLSVGSYSITAAYSGATGFAGSTSSALSQTIAQDTTTTTITSSAISGTSGQAITFTATVTSSGGVPTGSVNFDDGSGSIWLGGAALNGSGVCTFVISSLSVGAHSISAVFSGATNFASSSSGYLNQTIASASSASTTTTVSSSAASAAFGQSVTLTATVTSSGGTPGGSIMFDNGSNSLGTATLNSNGVATLTVSNLSVGSHSITAVYGGATNFSASTSSALSQTIAQDATTTTITSSAASATSGQAITFTATVTSSGGVPTGSVTFDDGSGSIWMGATALNGSGVCTFVISSLSVGTHSISAVYGGATNFASSSSGDLNQTITAASSASTTTNVSSSAASAAFGQSVTLTATVSSSGGTPGGSVTFDDGSTALGAATLNSSGVATLALSSLSVGSHSITAAYSGASGFSTSTSSALSQTITQAATTTSISTSASSATSGQAVTLTATVISAGGTPGGTVTFEDGSTSLGSVTLNSSGVGTLTLSSLSVGSHSITAIYGGATDFAGSTSSALSETISQQGSGGSTAPITVTQVQVYDGTRLLITGTQNGDSITISQSGSGITVADAGYASQTYAGTFASIQVDCGNGTNYIAANSSVTTTMYIYGGTGTETLIAGSGIAEIWGGGGTDSITCGSGNDVIVSYGDKSASIVGGSGFDTYWTNPTDTVTNYTAAEQALNSWHLVSGVQTRAEPAAGAAYQSFAGDPLFSDAGPAPTDIVQGQLDDCYYVSSLAAFAQSNPKLLYQMVVQLANGTYLVDFAGDGVYENVDAELPASGGQPIYAQLGPQNSMWVAIMEKAFAAWNQDSYPYISNGWMDDVYWDFGLNATDTYISSSSESQFTNVLQQDLAAGEAVTAAVIVDPSGDPLIADHAYEVSSVTVVNGVVTEVTLYNPWGMYVTVTTDQAYDAIDVVTASPA